MKKPLVSAIVTTYKREIAVVKRALDSIINQDYPNIEVILVNDCPQEKTLVNSLKKLTESYGGKVVYLEMPKNGGACAARNYGLSKSRGEFVAFLDDDDEWLPEKISKQVKCFDEDDIGIVYCNSYAHFEGKEKLVIREKGAMPEGEIYSELFKRNIISSTSFPLLRRSAIESVNGFNTEMPSLQDLELWLRIASSWKVKYIDEPLVTYYFYNGERISRHPERRTIAYEIIYKQHEPYLKDHPRIMAAYDRVGMTFYVNTREFKVAFQHLKRAIKLDPRSVKSNLFCLIKFVIRFFVKPKTL